MPDSKKRKIIDELSDFMRLLGVTEFTFQVLPCIMHDYHEPLVMVFLQLGHSKATPGSVRSSGDSLRNYSALCCGSRISNTRTAT